MKRKGKFMIHMEWKELKKEEVKVVTHQIFSPNFSEEEEEEDNNLNKEKLKE